MNQFTLFRYALMYYSRIPSGRLEYSEEAQRESLRYFPLVGLVVGVIGGVVWLLGTEALDFDIFLSTALALATMVFLTGGIHEDGLSDFCDGFGGGYTKERVLAIMKDSSTGVYGILALILDFMLKFWLIVSIQYEMVPFTIIVAHMSSRTLPLLLSVTSVYARTEQIKSEHLKKGMSTTSIVIAMILGLAPLATFNWITIASVLVGYGILFIVFRRACIRKIGGYTGDVLGALQQFAELLFYLIIVIIQQNIHF